jgi:hypothetical protein
MEPAWLGLIEGIEIQTVTSSYLISVCTIDDGITRDFPDEPLRGTDCWERRTITRQVPVKLPTDGIVNQHTATGRDSQWTKSNTKTVRADGVNHYEMGEHEFSTRLLDDAFNNPTSDYDQFFLN